MSSDWQYLSLGTSHYCKRELRSLEGFVFYLDPTGPRVDNARLHLLLGDILFRDGTIITSLDATHPLFVHCYFVRLGDANSTPRAERLPGWHYLIESGLTALIAEQDGEYLRSVQHSPHRGFEGAHAGWDGQGSSAATRGGREATLSTALSEMLCLGASAVKNVISKITAPSGGKAYETEEEEVEAVDNDL